MIKTRLFDRFPTEVEITRFLAKIDKTSNENGCWVWTGALAHGYGRFRFDNRTVQATRFSWFIHKKVQPTYELDHLCENPPCVNPDHLQDVTHKENILRASTAPTTINKAKVSCLNGHVFDTANTYITKSGKRHCRACERARDQKRYAKRYADYKSKKTNDSEPISNKLKPEDIQNILLRIDNGESVRSLALEYNVSPPAIRYHLKK